MTAPQQPKTLPFGIRMMGSAGGAMAGLLVGQFAVAALMPVTPECRQLAERMHVEGTLHLNPNPVTGQLSPQQQQLKECFGPASTWGFFLPLGFAFAGSIGTTRYLERRYNGGKPPGPR